MYVYIDVFQIMKRNLNNVKRMTSHPIYQYCECYFERIHQYTRLTRISKLYSFSCFVFLFFPQHLSPFLFLVCVCVGLCIRHDWGSGW